MNTVTQRILLIKDILDKQMYKYLKERGVEKETVRYKDCFICLINDFALS